MAAFPNPALDALLARIDPELVFAQVLILRCEEEFDLRHVEDRQSVGLDKVCVPELRAIGQFTARHEYRPLRTAPTLRRGWHCRARNQTELELALQHLYPGAVADWFAAQQPEPPVTPLREFVNRQTGIYRVTSELSDAALDAVASACCSCRFCLRQRLWKTTEAGPELGKEKSVVPCLEPCALLLELARRTAMIAHEEKLEVRLAPSEAAVIRAALESAVSRDWPAVRAADFSSPAHPLRAQLVLASLEELWPGQGANERSRPGIV